MEKDFDRQSIRREIINLVEDELKGELDSASNDSFSGNSEG